MKIRGITRPLPIIQGGMGVGVSLALLSGAVSAGGGLGTLSSACIDILVSKRIGRKVDTREAMKIEVQDAKRGVNLPVAVNIMVALTGTYEDSVLGAMDGGAEVIISGAGLPLNLPVIAARHPGNDETALVPIVSSGRAAELICKRWGKAGRLPDAMVVEGPEAGGHLGWKSLEDIADPGNRLENLLEEVLEVSKAFGGFPVIAAGGIYTREDIDRILALGAAGVQMGTRFLATKESGASETFKKAVLECGREDILVAVEPGSPCGMPFRIIKNSPMFLQTIAGERLPKCDKGYLLRNGQCPAKDDYRSSFCICNGLLSAADFNPDREQPLYTVGSNAARVDSVLSVSELLADLVGG